MEVTKCQLHDKEFEEHVAHSKENENAIRTSLHAIRNDLQSLTNKIEDMGYVDIKNGGGRQVTYKREEFSQMLYDNMKWKIKDIFKDIVLIISVLAAIISVLKMTFNL